MPFIPCEQFDQLMDRSLEMCAGQAYPNGIDIVAFEPVLFIKRMLTKAYNPSAMMLLEFGEIFFQLDCSVATSYYFEFIWVSVC